MGPSLREISIPVVRDARGIPPAPSKIENFHILQILQVCCLINRIGIRLNRPSIFKSKFNTKNSLERAMTTQKQAQPATSSTATNPSSAQSSSQNTSRSLGRQSSASPLSLFENDFSANPFTLMRRMQDEIERAFFGSSNNLPGIRVPFTETFEKDGKYCVRAELPGLKEDEVKVEVNDEGIVIQGAHSDQKEEKQGEGYRTERQYTEFYRVVPLPEEAQVEQARA